MKVKLEIVIQDIAQLNINTVEFHLMWLRNFYNIYMSNDVKFFETPCIFYVQSFVLMYISD